MIQVVQNRPHRGTLLFLLYSFINNRIISGIPIHSCLIIILRLNNQVDSQITRANNIKLKLVSNNKNKFVYEKVLVVKSIHNSKDSLKKVCKLQIKFSEIDCLTGYSVLILCYLKLISSLLFETNFVLLFALIVIWYVIINHGTSLYNL